MKTQTLFRLGALAAILTAVGFGVGESIYLFGDVETVFFAWIFIIVSVFQVFAVISLYVAQAKRGEIFTFIGFVLSIIGLLLNFMDSERRMALRTGLATQVLLEQAQSITSFLVLNAVMYWSTILGYIIFGFGTFRAGVFPRWTGILFLLVGVVLIFRDITGVEYIFAVLSVIAWGSLGWFLWKNPTSPEP